MTNPTLTLLQELEAVLARHDCQIDEPEAMILIARVRE